MPRLICALMNRTFLSVLYNIELFDNCSVWFRAFYLSLQKYMIQNFDSFTVNNKGMKKYNYEIDI